MTSPDLLDLPLRKRIRTLRTQEGLSLDALAKRLGTSRQVVIGWEAGARPSAPYRAALAKEFKLPREVFESPPSEAVTLAHLADHLDELGEGMEHLVEKLREDLVAELADVKDRVRSLEQQAEPRDGRSTGQESGS